MCTSLLPRVCSPPPPPPLTYRRSVQNNLVRCSFGALFVSVIDLIIDAMGPGWTYVLLSGLCTLFFPITFVLLRFGPQWRAKRRAKELAAEAAAAKA